MEIIKIKDNIYSLHVVLPDNPLRWLNCYVIKANEAGRNLLIDTGFNMPECLEPLLEGMDELGLRACDTDVFISHAHADHSGNAYALQQRGCRLIMGETDYRLLGINDWEQRKQRVLKEGMPQYILEKVFANNPAVLYVSEPFEATLVNDGDTLSYGGYELECVLTPGHTPGHICLYDRQKRMIFLGDHVLFDISPNINSRGPGTDALGDYLASLEKIQGLEVDIALPAHRTRGEESLPQRIKALISHHERRLAEAESIIARQPGLTAYEIAGLMQWRIRSKNWEDFPAGQKWFAVSEALAHLDRLLAQNKIRKEISSDGIVLYYIRQAAVQ